MNAADFLKIVNDNLSSGTLSPCDEIVIVDENNNKIDIKNIECDTQSSDFLINL